MTRVLKRRKDPGTILAMVMGVALFLMLIMYLYTVYGEQLRELLHVLARRNEDEFEAYIRGKGLWKGLLILIVACFIVENRSLLFYAPVLIISGILTGAVIGFLTSETLKRIQ